jgi:hypothetical protein
MLTDEQFHAFSAVNTELNALRESGSLTKSDYDRLLARARAAVGNYTPALESILMQGVQLGFISK